MTSNPSVVLLLLQLLGLRSSSEESRLVPCVIGCHSDEGSRDVELEYGCTVSVEKAHFVGVHRVINRRMSRRTASAWCSYARSDAKSTTIPFQ